MSGGDFINLRVRGIYGDKCYFLRMKRSTQLIKLMNAYCDRQSVELNITAFLFDGRRLHGKQTPDELEMEEGDEIIAYLRQPAGGNYGDEDKKPNTGAFINLKVKGIYGDKYYFIRMKRSTQLINLMNTYCDRQPVELNITAFLFDGRRLHGKQTPDELEMEEGDEIIAYLRQPAGGNYGDEDKKPNTGAFINLKVKGIYGDKYYFIRMKRSTQLINLMNTYCDRQPVELNITAFLFDGRRLHGKQTPDELEMEEGDEIIAYLRQPAGGNYGDEDKKPNTGAFINLKVKGIYCDKYYFIRMKRSTQLINLMNTYCDRQPVELNITAFLFDGRHLHGKQTPDELKMEEGDEIIAYLRQTGGNYGDLRM